MVMNRDHFKLEVQAASDIVSLIGEHVAVKPRGREFISLCPFHDDKNPSMTISPAKQIYKCFSCGAGGDVFSFVMDYHKMSFPEALRFLADRANLKMPESGSGGGKPEDPDKPSLRQRLTTVHQAAQRFFQKMLADPEQGAQARQYLADRGISAAMIEAFAIGYAPDTWDALAQKAASAGADLEALRQAGLISPRQEDGDYDRFRHRLMFPIFDAIGRPIAFGGRILPGSTREDNADAKYLNSPEHPLFNKSATLFGLHVARKPIMDSHTAIIVEGYTDVIGCHQAGVTNAVATLGTALTEQHAVLLRRYCDHVILVFDGDEAGLKAADRALGVFFDEPLDISIAVLPDGKDPADLLRDGEGLTQWDHLMSTARDAMGFQFDRIRAAFDNTDTMVFMMTALFVSLYTICLQSEELKALEELNDLADAMTNQNKVMEKQNFESTFFQMLRLFNEIIDGVHIIEAPSIGMSGKPPAEFHHRMAIKHLRDQLVNHFIGTKGSAECRQRLTKDIEVLGRQHIHGPLLQNAVQHPEARWRSTFPDDERDADQLLRAQLSKEELRPALQLPVEKWAK